MGDGAGQVVVLDLPGDGCWRVENSPARRVPSHGTDLLGLRYAIDLVGADPDGRSARVVDWRTVLAVEPPERFVGFGRPVLSPVAGTVVRAHDGEPDHGGRRSPVTLLPYALGQGGRLRRGVAAVAGNHVVVARADGACVAVAHLRAGSVRVRVGQPVAAGEPVGACGCSGNATEPHVHLQATDGPDPERARGLPIAFASYCERAADGTWVPRASAVPPEGAVVRRAEVGGSARDRWF
ncbi:M23 family metallopeptidase [Cellulomonas sp.]|uniref:M23 family metallopeptidase n=1 Tax=Cellulomonas sp. TaxID=40001 RepID=UPI002D2C2A2D|nr:M23 family metallopeptidase [Cellulomonas sp.]HYQ77423.1 M23 family metallopeptidase [Cellulomonas sp.]